MRSRDRLSGNPGDEQLTDSVKRTLRDASSQVGAKLDNVNEKAAAATEEATLRASELSERARAALKDATTSARDTATDTLAALRETVSGTYEAATEAVGQTGDQLGDTFTQSKQTLMEMIENHPLVVGGIGLLVGAMIASALPVTQAENRLLGETSDELKNRARNIASEGADVATAAAQTLYEEAALSVQEHDLTAGGVRQIVKDVGEKVKDVAQQASDALGKEDH
jgi:ElaB/YqjD/DUF883 family membrane-anchored ribosome-binding protein